MRTLRMLVLLMVAASTTTACSLRRGTNDKDEPAQMRSGPVKVIVDNKHWQDVTLYVIHDGARSRVGMVTATTIATFTMPPPLIGQTGLIRLIADPIGSRGGISTETIVVKPGQEVQWTLESQLQRSVVSVYE